MIFKAIIISASLIFQTSFALARDYIIIKEGDTLSEIAYKHIGHKVYGKYGSLQKLLSLNEDISNQNLVYIGEKINLKSDYNNQNKKVDASFAGNNTTEKVNNNRSPAYKKEASDSGIRNKRSNKNSRNSNDIQSLYFSLGSSIANIETLDTKSNREENAVSELGYGLTGVWTHLWSDQFTGFIVGGIKKYDFIMAKSKTLTNQSITQKFIGSGVNYLYNRVAKSKLSLGVGLGESIILKSITDATTFKMDKVIIPTLYISGTHHILSSKNRFNLTTFWRIGAFLPTSQLDFDTEWGYFYNLGLGSNYNLNGNIINYSVGFTGRKVNMGAATQTSKELNFSLGYGWSF